MSENIEVLKRYIEITEQDLRMTQNFLEQAIVDVIWQTKLVSSYKETRDEYIQMLKEAKSKLSNLEGKGENS